MSEIESSLIKRGKWTNLSQGYVMGQTITTDVQTGTTIIAILAIFSSLGMAHLFHLCTFFYHQYRATGQPGNGLFRQQQALLRTLPDPSTLATGSIKLWLSWKHISKENLHHCLLQATVAIAFLLASVSASIFSSSVVSSTDLEVLVKSPSCAYLQINDSTPKLVYISAVASIARGYANDCYTNRTTVPVKCKTFIRPRISFETETVPCPFADGFCATPALAFDSGLMDLSTAFGLNLATEDRVEYRKRTTATVMSLDGRVKVVNASDVPMTAIGRAALPGEELLCGNFGSYDGGATFSNCTFFNSLAEANISRGYGTMQMTSREEEFHFLPGIKREDADLALLALSKNSVAYSQPVNDPLFAAHQVAEKSLAGQGASLTFYLSDFPVSFVGFMSQYQVCITNTTSHKVCSELGGCLKTSANRNFPGASEVQLSVLNLLYTTACAFNQVIIGNVQASELRFGGLVGRVPDDQWKTEFATWESQVWAAHQIAMADYAAGPALRVPSGLGITRNASSVGDKKLCGMQKMRKTGDVVNINYFGLLFILSISGLITTVDIFILRFLLFLKVCRQFWTPRIHRWMQDGVWQLQRRAYEAYGKGDWVLLSEEVPVTTRNTMLSDLPLETLPWDNSPPSYVEQTKSSVVTESAVSAMSFDSPTQQRTTKAPKVTIQVK